MISKLYLLLICLIIPILCELNTISLVPGIVAYLQLRDVIWFECLMVFCFDRKTLYQPIHFVNIICLCVSLTFKWTGHSIVDRVTEMRWVKSWLRT